jgi:hypothetical protein
MIAVFALRLSRRSLVLLFSLAILSLGAARPVGAENTATQAFRPPARTAESDVAARGSEFVGGIGNVVLAPSLSADGDHLIVGTLGLWVVDGRGLGHGWAVTVAANDVRLGATTVPDERVAIRPVGSVTVVQGQAVSEAGPHSPGASRGGTLDQERLVVVAGPHTGNEAYRQDLRLSLLSPGEHETVTVSASLTVTIAAAP